MYFPFRILNDYNGYKKSYNFFTLESVKPIFTNCSRSLMSVYFLFKLEQPAWNGGFSCDLTL
jgi:hypothetical protein